MTKGKLIFLFLCLSLGRYTLVSQTMDSLNSALKNANHDTVRLKLYIKLCDACDVKDNLKYAEPAILLIDKMLSKTKNESERKNILRQKAYLLLCFAIYYREIEGSASLKELNYFKEALEINEKIKDENGIANSISQVSFWYVNQGNYPEALAWDQKGITLFKQLNYKKGIARLLANIAGLYRDQGLINTAIENFEKTLVICKELKDTNSIATRHNDLGYNYGTLRNFKKALENFNHAILLFKTIKNKQGLRNTYNTIGLMYLNNDMWEEALTYFEKSLFEAEQLSDKSWTRGILSNIGFIQRLKGNSDKALEYHFRALKAAEETNNELQVSWVFNRLSEDYLAKKNYKKAKEYSDRFLTIIKKSTYLFGIRDGELLASKIDSSLGNYKDAFEHYKQFVILKEKLNSEEFVKTATKEKYSSEYEQKKIADKVEQDKIDLKNAEEKQKQKVIIFAVIVVLLLTSIFSALLYKRFRLTNSQKKIIEGQKHIVEEKHKEITDSINYAERIQRSFLATKEHLDANLSEYFILFKPKDVVSGDFYWSATLKNGLFALVTADSTGHGVPGAIMSLLNISGLEKAIETHTEPADVLNSTRKTIIERLKKDGSLEGGKDGMDASLCVYDFKNEKLIIAAANNPVWIVRGKLAKDCDATDYEVIEIKPDKMPIGKHDKDTISFTQQEIDLQTGDVIYSLTDGFPDQFGGDNGKKFMSKNLRELLAANAHLPMSEQKQILEKTFANWIGIMEQVDDVCIIGVRVL